MKYTFVDTLIRAIVPVAFVVAAILLPDRAVLCIICDTIVAVLSW